VKIEAAKKPRRKRNPNAKPKAQMTIATREGTECRTAAGRGGRVVISLGLNQAVTVGRCSSFANHFMELANKAFNADVEQLQAINAAISKCDTVFRDLAKRRASDVVITSMEAA
jgi:hypothetical protein